MRWHTFICLSNHQCAKRRLAQVQPAGACIALHCMVATASSPVVELVTPPSAWRGGGGSSVAAAVAAAGPSGCSRCTSSPLQSPLDYGLPDPRSLALCMATPGTRTFQHCKATAALQRARGGNGVYLRWEWGGRVCVVEHSLNTSHSTTGHLLQARVSARALLVVGKGGTRRVKVSKAFWSAGRQPSF